MNVMSNQPEVGSGHLDSRHNIAVSKYPRSHLDLSSIYLLLVLQIFILRVFSLSGYCYLKLDPLGVEVMIGLR